MIKWMDLRFRLHTGEWPVMQEAQFPVADGREDLTLKNK